MMNYPKQQDVTAAASHQGASSGSGGLPAPPTPHHFLSGALNSKPIGSCCSTTGSRTWRNSEAAAETEICEQKSSSSSSSASHRQIGQHHKLYSEKQ